MDDLCYLPATELLARFRDRSLSPVEILEAQIARAARVEPVVNALCITYYDEALEQARAAEARYQGRGEAPRPLEGISFAIKDEVPVAGQPCSEGSLLMKDDIAERTDPFVQRMFDAGAIGHARATCPEFSCAGFTHSRLWGVTRNPWNPEFGVGGSSGGSGAALASGTTTLATGSDIGGSTRIPAAWNGVVGFKAPYGRVPVMAPFSLDTYCHNGPMARTVADTALFQNIIQGMHPLDAASIPALPIPAQLDGIEGLRVAYCIHPGGWPVDAEIVTNTRAAAEALRDAGAVVEEIEMSERWSPDSIWEISEAHFGAIFGALIAEGLEHRELMTDYAVKWAEQTVRSDRPGAFLHGLQRECELHAELAEIHERYDLLIWPTTASRGLAAGDSYVDHGLEIGGRDCEYFPHSCMTTAFNICSRNPVMAVPSGFADNGVPTGIQIVGRRYDDVTAFRAAAALERVRPWAYDRAERRPQPAIGG